MTMPGTSYELCPEFIACQPFRHPTMLSLLTLPVLCRRAGPGPAMPAYFQYLPMIDMPLDSSSHFTVF
jgi:hypothetical protein